MYTIGWDILDIFVARTNPTPGEEKSKVGTSALRSSMLDTLILTVAVYALAEQTLICGCGLKYGAVCARRTSRGWVSYPQEVEGWSEVSTPFL